MTVIFTCEQCSIKFFPSRTGQVRRFCGTECAKKSRPCKTTHCLQCNTVTFNPKFCSKSCAATHSNLNRAPMTERQKQAISKTLKARKKRKATWKDNIFGPYTIAYRNVCCKTGLIFYAKTWQKYHPSVIADKKHYAVLCKFRFSIGQFPLWFDGKIILDHGWYSTPGSRKGVKNLNGVSRDHRISVDYGYQHGIDPQIIQHPANCHLVLHTENQRKNTKCSITIEKLMDDISAFDALYPKWHK